MHPIHRNFEVQTLRNGQWQTEAVHDSEHDARQFAEKVLGENSCGGARIIGNRIHRDGSVNGEIVFHKRQAAKTMQPIRIDVIDKIPVFCETADDVFTLQSRMIINRVLRTYLETALLTPTELLHGFKHLQRLGNRKNLLSSALGHIAKLQTDGTFRPREDRQDELFDLATRIVTRAKRAEELRLPKLGRLFSETLAAVSGVDYDRPEYLAMVVLSKSLGSRESWLEKLDLLCRLAADETEEDALLLIDTVVADVLGGGFLDALTNANRSLGDAISGLFDLADGRYEVAGGAAIDTIDTLNGLLSDGSLPASRRVIIDRALRLLRTATPIYRSDPAKEMEEYQRALVRVMVPNGRRHVPADPEPKGTRLALRPRGPIHLAKLTEEHAEGEGDGDIIDQLDTVFSARVIGQLYRRSINDGEKLTKALDVDAEAFWAPSSDADAQIVCEHIDGVLERYLIEENIIEKLDRPDDSIRERAIRLARFCGAGVLPEGKALNMARQRVVRLLREPRFDTRFVEDIHDAEAAERALQDFNELLVKARLA